MNNADLHILIAETADQIERLEAVVEAAKRQRLEDPASDSLGNVTAQTGCDRCRCGNKYWKFDRCIDCREIHDADKIREYDAIREVEDDARRSMVRAIREARGGASARPWSKSNPRGYVDSTQAAIWRAQERRARAGEDPALSNLEARLGPEAHNETEAEQRSRECAQSEQEAMFAAGLGPQPEHFGPTGNEPHLSAGEP